MRKLLYAATALCAISFIQPASAAPVTYNFTPVASGNTDLGQTEAYAVAGAPTLTAVAGVAGVSAPAERRGHLLDRGRHDLLPSGRQ